MTQELPPDAVREVVAAYGDKPGFTAAVEALLAAGFDRTDLSVLASHDSLAVAAPIAGYESEPAREVEAGLAGEWGVLESISLLGALLLVGGPIAAATAAVVGTGAGVMALRPLFAELTQSAHAEGFAAAVEAGRILLWVRTADADAADRACAILAGTGGRDIARLARPGHEISAL